VQLSLASFFIGLSLGQLLYGTVSDRYGRKRPLQMGMAIYVLAALGCALAPNVEALIVFRGLQAVGACAGIVIARAVVRDLYELGEAARVFSLLMLVMGVAPILAPLAGGAMVAQLGWRAIFAVLVVAGSAAWVGARYALPETKEPDPAVRLSRTLGLSLEILRDRAFLRNALGTSLAQAGMFAYITGSPHVLIDLYGIKAENFGWVFGANAAGLIGMSQWNRWLLRHRRPPEVLRWGLLWLAGSAIGLLAFAGLGGGFALLLGLLFCYVAGMGVVFPNATASALAHQVARAGAASALLGTLQFAVATGASAAVSWRPEGGAAGLAVTIAVCGLLAFAVHRGLGERA
jgi:DHA1 family bicyclomycin/chloramphenicol resistance-like MFS transporter